MNAQPFKALWENPTFVNLIRTLPTVLTSSLFMLFGLLEVALACLKWMLFVLIITATFLFGLGLLTIFILALAGVLMGSAKEEGGAEVREDAKQDVHPERKVEQEKVVVESDAEKRATHSPPKTFDALDTSGGEETEDGVKDFWPMKSEEIEEEDDREALRRAIEEFTATINEPSPSPEHRT